MNGNPASKQTLATYFQTGSTVRFKKDEIIVRPGEDPGFLYMITNGFVSSYTITKYGETNVLIINKPGDVFPLSAAVGHRLPTTYREARSEVVAVKVSRTEFLKATEADHGLKEAVMSELVELTNMYEERIKELEFRSARERIMARLYMLAERYGKQTSEGVALELPHTHQDFADALNMSRETASRELEYLTRHHILTRKGKVTIITDMKPLAKLFE